MCKGVGALLASVLMLLVSLLVLVLDLRSVLIKFHAADGARVVLLEPVLDAFAVEGMLARKLN